MLTNQQEKHCENRWDAKNMCFGWIWSIIWRNLVQVDHSFIVFSAILTLIFWFSRTIKWHLLKLAKTIIIPFCLTEGRKLLAVSRWFQQGANPKALQFDAVGSVVVTAQQKGIGGRATGDSECSPPSHSADPRWQCPPMTGGESWLRRCRPVKVRACCACDFYRVFILKN